MSADDRRFARQDQEPALLVWHRALSRLKSVITLMNSGAHPDDEDSGLLAYLRFQHGMRALIACSTRGEGGQNVLGPERGGALGLLRSQEMEQAARALDADVVWLGHGPDDPVHDFGFSKSGDDTAQRWGRDRLLERMVRAYREERPDIVLPTFLDVAGQHGHHRAMTWAAEEALALAADPKAFPEHLNEGLTPWQVAKFYLPAVSGASSAYDDELPPPPATLTLVQQARDTASGADFDVLGQMSRRAHRSQSMGHWPDPARREWVLHLKLPQSVPETDICAGLPRDLGDLAEGCPPALAAALRRAQAHIDEAISAFPDRASVADDLAVAAAALDQAIACATPPFMARHGHRLQRKAAELDAALFATADLQPRATLDLDCPRQGDSTALRLVISDQPMLADVKLDRVAWQLDPALGRIVQRHPGDLSARLDLAPDCAPPLFLPQWSRLGGNGALHLRLSAWIAGRLCHTTIDTDLPLQVLPASQSPLSTDTLVQTCTDGVPFILPFKGGPAPAFDLPAGWQISLEADALQLHPPHQGPCIHSLAVLQDGQKLSIATPITGSAPQLYWRAPQRLHLLRLDLVRPEHVRIGYIGGGADQVGLWLQRLGFDVTLLDDEALQGDLSGFTTLVVGVLAFGARPVLWQLTQKLHGFVRAGGNLVTLYQRPSDGWQPDLTPPARLQIGSPSLRWRVTDPQSQVQFLQPDHPLIQGPNPITQDDFKGWHKERGLYFAADWDKAYQPLFAMADAGEPVLHGAWLTAELGQGRHSHVALALHHQMDRHVAGAFRMMANLVQPIRH